MSDEKRRIYTLNGLPPEVVAVAFAKTSRSPEPFDEIAAELSEEKSAQFHERWVVGYGHASVAEHANLSVAIENVSRLAIECIESNRLASYTEKSTRYQVFERSGYYKPKEIMNSKYAKEYTETVEYLYDDYMLLTNELLDYYKKEIPMTENEKPASYEIKLRAKALDSTRFLLPNCALASVGMTINARSLEHALVKMFSHQLREVREIGAEIKRECLKVTPTLIKYTNPSEYLMSVEKELTLEASGMNFKESNDYVVKLVESDQRALDVLVASVIYRFSNCSYEQAREKVKGMDMEERLRYLDKAMSKLGRFDIPLRELEHAYFTFDCLMDQGAYYEFKRHRMCTQTVQGVAVKNGYEIPEDVVKVGHRKKFEEDMKRADEVYNRIFSEFPNEAAYIATNAHKRRVLATMNLREIIHFIRLRGSSKAHFTIREVALKMLEELNRKHPEFAKYFNPLE